MPSLLGSCWKASFNKRNENPTQEDTLGIRRRAQELSCRTGAMKFLDPSHEGWSLQGRELLERDVSGENKMVKII